MPLVELVVPARVVDVAQHRVIQIPRPALVVAARKKLDHLPPVCFVLRVKELLAVIIQDVYCPKKKIIGHVVIVAGQLFNVFMAEIVHVKLLRMDLVHRAARVRHRADLVLIGLLPPVQRCSHVELHVDHAQELPVILTGVGKRRRELPVCRAEVDRLHAALVRAQRKGAVALRPTVLRVSHATDRGLKSEHLCILNRQHAQAPPSCR